MDPDTRPETHPFTPAELERLYAFKQAVAAGFYTDYPSHDTMNRKSNTAWPPVSHTAPRAADA
jgi:hypothetical protein